VNKAFVLGAGLGERLRPLTDQLPKPLVPVYHRPLITYAFDHLRADLDVGEFVVNTFHLAEAYEAAFPEGHYQQCPVRLRKDAPVRLETAGGLANVRDLLEGSGTFAVYNGDILTDLPLQPLLDAHRSGGHLVTLALRSSGPALHIGIDASGTVVTDIRNKLATGNEGTHLFTGIYLVEPEFFDWLTPGEPQSVIPVFLELIRQGHRLGCAVIDDGHWWDLGNRESYLEAHRALADLGSAFPRYGGRPLMIDAPPLGVTLTGTNVIGAGARVAPGVALRDCVLWPHAVVESGAQLQRCIVRSHATASGVHTGTDF
jgi:mannose-1-phosphate guanylyltransferase